MRGLMVALVLSLSPGCLSSSYRVSGEELTRLAALPPSTRWEQVRAVQDLGGSDHPPDNTPPMVAPGFIAVPNYSLGRTTRNRSGGSGVSTGSGGGSSGSSGGGGNLDPRVILVAVVLVGAVVFVLAGSEGARYDGWVGVDPNETLYLVTDQGIQSLPLSALTPEIAARSYGATLFESSGAPFDRVGRAPLNRVGLTIQSAVGASMVPNAAGGASVGVSGSAFLGGFFVQQIGLGLAMDIAGADGNLYGSIGPELQIMPITYLGAYGSVGYAGLLSNSSLGGTSLRAGLQAELPITTRLSARFRVGGSRADLSDAGPAQWLGELSAGMSVY